MSRTHKTKPFWVKMKQGHLKTEEFHDHTESACDLPAQVELDEWQRKNHCRHGFTYTGINTCGPSCCGSRDYYWDAIKRPRLAGKSLCDGEWHKEYESSDPELDYWVNENPHWYPGWER